MKRFVIIGSGGAGKSTFAKRLHEMTGIEVIHLDKIYWKQNWTEPAKEEWRKIIETLVEGNEWIMDGNFGGTMEMRIAACDTVIFLDLPRLVCIRRLVGRIAKYRGTNRPDMAEGCHEKFDLKFLRWVWDYPRRTKPKVEALLKRFEAEKMIIHLASKNDVERFFTDYSKTFVVK